MICPIKSTGYSEFREESTPTDALEIRVGYECVTDACRWWSLTFSECAVKRIAESLTDLSHIMNDMKNPKPLMEDGK